MKLGRDADGRALFVPAGVPAHSMERAMTFIPETLECITDHTGAQDWIQDSVVLDPENLSAQAMNGKGPFVIRGFHGTMRQFEIFDLHAHANMEAQFGPVLYFSTSANDAWSNYALASGQDVRIKISNMQDRLFDEIDYNPDQFGLGEDPSADEISERARSLARAHVIGDNPVSTLLDCGLRFSNPFIIDPSKRWQIPGFSSHDDITPDLPYPEDGDEDAMESWYEALDELREKQNQRLMDAFSAAESALGMDVGSLRVPQRLLDDRFDGTSTDLEDAVIAETDYAEHPETGALLSNAIVGQVVRALGFDAIILLHANRRFHNMSMDQATHHIHLFEHKPETIQIFDRIKEDEPVQLACAA